MQNHGSIVRFDEWIVRHDNVWQSAAQAAGLERDKRVIDYKCMPNLDAAKETRSESVCADKVYSWARHIVIEGVLRANMQHLDNVVWQVRDNKP